MPAAGRFLFRILAPVALAACALHAQEPIKDFKSGQPTGVYSFATSSPKTFSELIKSGSGPEDVNITGNLFLPKGDGKVPIVVLMHGSGGVYKELLDFWPKLLDKNGVAAFVLDRFGPRGVKSTAEDQSQIPFAADVADAFAA
ncbi:MAG TPA: hypothetical protein VN436_16985, partial [Holophaga sp.]|nr:hypothetical protein [Holophaga sp.]